ncbi:MAG: bifunctional ornithine acetyltransferase/N-acetylglutamate synthase [Oscillospiraceae bacterium]|jgi:glutamate N-acetyltransferase/amino-acid N-acetyltransferase|nr:bifunctional ornithine acetyltransferase/N-acetylglutamate synthase [Oscillospiraceae bacterium]
MSENLKINQTPIPGGVCAPKGFIAGGVHCGIRRNQSKKDVCLIAAECECTAAAVYTQNLVKGAPLAVTKRHLENGRARAVICNSGNANTCAPWGEAHAEAMCQIAAEILGIDENDVMVASTGVIGQELPIDPIKSAADALRISLSADENGSDAAANAIMTTDTFKKEYACSFALNGVECKIGGIAKGSGMINPNMATMLAFITTDVKITPQALQTAVRNAAKSTFNTICVDGDTSTNDMFTVLASGLAGNREITENSPLFDVFTRVLTDLCTLLSRDLARDGEGATKLITCAVYGASSPEAARVLAKSVVSSSLVKAAMFGSDANWGRVLCALGYAGVDFDPETVEVVFFSEAGQVKVCESGRGLPFDEEHAKRVLREDEINIKVSLQSGSPEIFGAALGCDLTYDYVKINGDYRT